MSSEGVEGSGGENTRVTSRNPVLIVLDIKRGKLIKYSFIDLEFFS